MASLGAIRLLVALLAHDLIDETSLKVANKSTSIHSIVKNIGQNKTVGSGAGGGNASTTDLDQRVDDFNKKMGEKQVPVLDGLANSTHSQKVYPTKQASALHQGNQNHRDKEDPKIKVMLKAEAAHALWKLAKNNIKNSKQITDTRALLCFAKLIETDHGMVKYNSIMAIMEIAAAAERDKELRRAAFKTNSTAVKAVVECLLRVLEQEADEPDLQVCQLQSL